MPKVPGSQSNIVPGPGPSLDPTYVAMAVAQMHEMGRLIEPDEMELHTPTELPPPSLSKDPA